MVKCGCGAILGPDDKFCPGCGAKSVVEETSAVASVSAAAQEAHQGYSGKRGGSETVGKTRVYYGMAGRSEELARAMQDYLMANGYDPKVTKTGRETVLRVKQAGFLRAISGTRKCITIRIGVQGDNLVTSVGDASWLDKVIVLFIGLFITAFLVGIVLCITSIYGTWQQYSLDKEVKEELGVILASMR